MLTQTIPSLVNAMQGELSEPALKALTQALGNCNQPLTHRGDMATFPRDPKQNGPGAIYRDQFVDPPWPPEIVETIRELLPTINNVVDNSVYNFNPVDVPGWSVNNTWNTNNYQGDNFSFPSTNEFNTTNYFGGPNVYNAGNTFTNNQFTNNHTTNNLVTNNLFVTNINGQPVAGPAGPPGSPGAVVIIGLPGAPGAAGAAGAAGMQGAAGMDGADGAAGADAGPIFYRRTQVGPYYAPARGALGPTVDVQDKLEMEFEKIQVPTTATLNAETCEVTLGGLVDYWVVSNVNPKRRLVEVKGLFSEGPKTVVETIF